MFSMNSYHPGGVQVLLFDGAVRFVSENVDHSPEGWEQIPTGTPDSLLEYLLAISDGNPVGDY